MPTKKKKFIDKKKSVTFHLVHRSQQDPLAADETAPQHVLFQQPSAELKGNRVQEQRKFGIYYDDDYNYLQHLKDADEVPHWEPVVSRVRLPVLGVPDDPLKTHSIQLPSSVFASEVEEPVGLLNKAAPHSGPRPEWDPDVIAALDDDFAFDDPENELEDDFINLASGKMETIDEDRVMDEDEDELFSDDDEDDEFERNTRFTNYSISSSILPRSEILQTLDERFEKMFEEYDDDGMGALDGEDISGFLNPQGEMLQNLLDNFEDLSQKQKMLEQTDAPRHKVCFEEEETLISVEQEPRRNTEQQWDCESILSTYSNLYNRPKLISEKKIEISGKYGIPKNVLQGRLTEKQLKTLDGTNNSKCLGSTTSRATSVNVARKKEETAQERKERKKVVKEMRRERRTEKKANKSAFKDELHRQQQVLQNLRQNLQGIKLH